ncbi:hypothetical protein E2P81_ATG09608 [Venturia nashicola]|nr:hypothetical protein E2P81_ATG09608 [Venturia nashicola]
MDTTVPDRPRLDEDEPGLDGDKPGPDEDKPGPDEGKPAASQQQARTRRGQASSKPAASQLSTRTSQQQASSRRGQASSKPALDEDKPTRTTLDDGLFEPPRRGDGDGDGDGDSTRHRIDLHMGIQEPIFTLACRISVFKRLFRSSETRPACAGGSFSVQALCTQVQNSVHSNPTVRAENASLFQAELAMLFLLVP